MFHLYARNRRKLNSNERKKINSLSLVHYLLIEITKLWKIWWENLKKKYLIMQEYNFPYIELNESK